MKQNKSIWYTTLGVQYALELTFNHQDTVSPYELKNALAKDNLWNNILYKLLLTCISPLFLPTPLPLTQTYSGMFTHHIRPALSMVQVTELFRLLGYHVSVGASGEEELRLGTSPMLADDLLQLACSFFLARCECLLLLSSLEPLSRPLAQASEWELRLVQERRRGHSLQGALQSVQRSLGAPVRSVKEICCDAMSEVDEDLYTGEEDGGSSSPVAVEVPIQSRGSHSPLKQAHSSPVLSTGAASSQTSRLCVSTFNYQVTSPSSPGGGTRPEPHSGLEEQTFQKPVNSSPSVTQKSFDVCSCVESINHYYLCQNCNMLHSLTCAILDHCQELRHNVVFSSHAGLPEASELRELKLRSPKDKRSPPGFPLRHLCLEGTDKPHITCHTCRLAHDCLCEEGQQCAEANHKVEYQLEPSQSMPFHKCCTSTHPQFACLTCRVFHSESCPTGDPCKETHSVHMLKHKCDFKECSLPSEVLCRHCCTQFCRACWYKSPLQCLCGKPYEHFQSSV